MSKLIFSFSILLFLFSCKDKDELPKGVLPKKKMQEVLWDMVRAGEFLNGFVLYKDTAANKAAISQAWYERIYKLHKITKKDFDNSYAYYQKHPVLMKEMLDSLSKKQVPVKQPVQDSTAKKDSLAARDSIQKKIIQPLKDAKKIKALDSLKRSKLNRRKIIRKGKLQPVQQ